MLSARLRREDKVGSPVFILSFSVFQSISIALIEELKDALKKDTIYASEQSMEVKSDNLPGLTSSTKPHSAEWTP